MRGFAPLVQVCVAEHDATSPKVSKIATLAFAKGPSATNETWPLDTLWAAWITGGIIKAAKGVGYTLVPPASGTQSVLFPSTSGTSLSLAFNATGNLALAVQSSADQITLKHYTSDLGGIETFTITGRSPLLWFTGELYSAEEGDFRELVLLYLRPEKPRSLFGRFQGESFATEYELEADLPVDLASLTHAEATAERKLLLYARSDSGRDVTLYSTPYAAHGDDQASLAPSFTAGFYFDAAVNEDAGQDDGTLQCAFTSGYYYLANVSAGATQRDNQTLAIAFTAGEYE